MPATAEQYAQHVKWLSLVSKFSAAQKKRQASMGGTAVLTKLEGAGAGAGGRGE